METNQTSGASQETPESTQKKSKARPGRIIAACALCFLIGLGLGAALAVDEIPQMWHVMARHSDTPEQVIQAIGELDREMAERTMRLNSEIEDRLAEVRYARTRALRKAEESRQGIGEPGETIDDAKRQELLRRVPKWEEAAEKAAAVLNKYQAG